MLTLSCCPYCSSPTTPEAVLTPCPRCGYVRTPAEWHSLRQRWGLLQQIADARLAFVVGCGLVILSLLVLCVGMVTGADGFTAAGGWLLSSGFCLSVAVLLFGEHYLYGAWETWVSPEESRRWQGSWALPAVTARR